MHFQKAFWRPNFKTWILEFTTTTPKWKFSPNSPENMMKDRRKERKHGEKCRCCPAHSYQLRVISPALLPLQHRVPLTVLWVHWGQQLLGCDPPAPFAVGLSGTQRDWPVPGHHRRRHPRSIQGHGEQKSNKLLVMERGKTLVYR